MDGKYSDIELLFIREVLDQHGEFVVDALHDRIEQLKMIASHDLLDSLNYKTTNIGINPVLQISFFSYGRALEIRWHKMRSNKRMLADTKKDIWGVTKKSKRRKNVLWYSRTVYGSVNRLLLNLATEYTEKEQERLRGILDKQKIKIKV